jgi:SSS family solute:Na+ symporter
VWSTTSVISSKTQLDLVGIVMGLGGAISFSYWCTDYGLIQRALTARNLESARRVPLIAGFGKLLFAFVIVVPVILASSHLHARPDVSLDETAPALIAMQYGPRLVGIGFAALIAGLLNSLAANIAAFSSLWTGEIYRPFLNSNQTESHYRNIGRAASALCVVIGIVVAFCTRSFENLSAFVLLIFSLFVIPFFAVLLTGVLSRHTTARSAIGGAVAGILAGAGIQLAFAQRWLPSGSRLSANFYSAIVSFTMAAVFCNLPPLFSRARRLPAAPVEVRSSKPPRPRISVTVWSLAATLLVVCVAANLLWW